jgi:hypothetical protein
VPSRKARSPDASMSSAARNGSARGCGEPMPRSCPTRRPGCQPPAGRLWRSASRPRTQSNTWVILASDKGKRIRFAHQGGALR